MGFLSRRRSSVIKIVILLSAVWFTILFLIFSDDGKYSSSNIVASEHKPHSLELKSNNDFDGDGNGNVDGDDVNENSIDNINENVDRFFNNEPKVYKNSANSVNQKNDSVVNNVISSNFNNNDNLNSNKNFNDDASVSNIFGKNKRLNAHQRLDMDPPARKPSSDDNGETLTKTKTIEQIDWH